MPPALAARAPGASVIRFSLGALAVLGLGAFVAVTVARALGWSGSRASLLASVTAQWLGAWVLWAFAGQMAVHAGLIASYEPMLFAAVAVPAALVQYRAAAGAGRDRGRTIFVGAQLAWLVVVLILNRMAL